MLVKYLILWQLGKSIFLDYVGLKLTLESMC
jgi:hypothetical protein